MKSLKNYGYASFRACKNILWTYECLEVNKKETNSKHKKVRSKWEAAIAHLEL